MSKDFNFSTAKPVSEVPSLQKLRKAYQESQTNQQDDLVNFFDSDVQEIIKQHNTPQDRMRVNQMIRLLFAID